MPDLKLQHNYACALASKLAYPAKDGEKSRFAFLRSEMMKLGFNLTNEYDEGETQFSVFESENDMIIAFRGTESVGDLINDLKYASQTKISAGKVSSVALACATQAFAEVSDVIASSDRWNLTITGHSFGGAVATIIAHLIEKDDWIAGNHPDLITFGSPRPGDRKFANTINRTIYHRRWVNGNDVVTKIPFLLGKFRHASNYHLYISVDGERWINPSVLRVFIDRWGWFRRSFFRWATDQFADHAIDSYIESIFLLRRESK